MADSGQPKQPVVERAVIVSLGALIIVTEEHTGRFAVAGTLVNQPVERMIVAVTKAPTEEFGNDLGRNVFDVLAAVARDGLDKVGGKSMKKTEGMD